jgi:hypothetical protein
MNLRVYIAGPYTNPDPVSNTATALTYFADLMQMGFQPYCPHLVSHTAAMICDYDYDRWMDLCFAWVRASHVVVRISGHSPGADREVALATELGIPVFESTLDGQHIEKLKKWAANQNCHNSGRPAEGKPPGGPDGDAQQTCQT